MGERTLTLLHLRKTFSEQQKLDNGVRNDDIARLLPLFTKATSMFNARELLVEFKEMPMFCAHLATVFVREIKQRAMSEGTVRAAAAIAEYLSPGSSNNKGWLILNSIAFILATESDTIVDEMCKASVPSTLVRSVYLFFDLPPIDDAAVTESLVKLKDLLTSIMDKLCTYRSVCDELAKKDDLVLLFDGSSTTVPKSNAMWKKLTCRSLETLSSSALTPLAIKHVHTRNCITSFIDNINASTCDSQDVAEMVICLLCVLKDSALQTNQLLEDFNNANGYLCIKEFLLKNVKDVEMVRNILVMLISLITSGRSEIKPQYTTGLIELSNFVLPVPTGGNVTVRNTDAFNLLYQVFLEANDEATSCTVVDVIHSLYSSDAANYFILDKEYPLSIFLEQMEQKTRPVKEKLLEMVELALFQLHHIPCKELISLAVLMKTESAKNKVETSTLIVQMAFRLQTVDPIIKDALREVGLFDALCHSLAQLRKSQSPDDAARTKLCLLVTDLLTVLIKGNADNAKLFSECFGASALLSLCAQVEGDWRHSALQLLKQLIVTSSGEQFVAALSQSFVQISPLDDIKLNSDFLKTLLAVLRESHKVRVHFRKTGGYLNLVSFLLAFEAHFGNCQQIAEKWEALQLVHSVFKVLTVSMRYEPSNAKYFGSEVCWDSLTTVLRLTGAFTEHNVIDVSLPQWKLSPSQISEHLKVCHEVFRAEEATFTAATFEKMPPKIFYCCYFVRLLFNMALDNYEKTSDVVWATGTSIEESVVSWNSAVLVHPGAALSILFLLPAIRNDETADDEKWTTAAQFYCTQILKAILRSERNQQLMCQMDMPKHVLTIAAQLFVQEEHLLLQPFCYLLERLSYQAMQPAQLRQFLRLDLPLCCRSLDEEEGEPPLRAEEGGPLPLQRVKALVSMMTSRDERVCQAPSFVEFDMSIEGFASLFAPSFAPIFTKNTTERIFPPLNGMSYSTWFYIDSFSDKKTDAHPLRLFTIFRTVTWQDERRKASPSNLLCLAIELSALDRSLLISTDEIESSHCDLEKNAAFPSDKSIRVSLGDVLRPCEWYHLVIVFSRSVLKPSQVTVYLNGRALTSQKLQYIVQSPGGTATQQATTHAVNAYIGSLPATRRPSRLRFRIASTFVMEEALTQEAVRTLYGLQPSYIGNLQTVGPEGAPLVAEEKITFSLNATATNEMTLARIRALHSRIDAELLAPHLGISAQDNSTPLRILVNTAAHASGASRSFGGVVVGYLGVRTFSPRAVPRLLDSIGGYACLFGLVAMATDAEGLYASLKALVSAVRANRNLQRIIARNRAYQTLAVLLEDKSHLLNTHILHMVFALVGTLDTGRETNVIPSSQAFEDLLCDLDVWKNAPEELYRMLFEHCYELITDNQRENLSCVRRSALTSRLLFVAVECPRIVLSTNDVFFNLLAAILQPPWDRASNNALLKLGQCIAAMLPPKNSTAEKDLPFHIAELQSAVSSTKRTSDGETPSIIYLVYVRNRLLNMLANLLSHSSAPINQNMCDQVARTLGFDWLFALMSPGVHSGTVYLSMRILLSLLAHPTLLTKFRDGSSNGGWLAEADSVVRNRAAVLLGFSVSAHGGSVGGKIDVNPEMQHINGFAALEHLLAEHASEAHVYFAMMSLLVGQPVKNPRFCDNFTVDEMWSGVFALPRNGSVFEAIRSSEFCFQALVPVFAMIRACISSGNMALEGWHVSNPCTVIQILLFLYQNSPSFFQAAHSEEFIVTIFSSLIPAETSAVESRGSDSPMMAAFQDTLTLPSSKSVLDLTRRILCDELHTATRDNLIDSLIEAVGDGGFARQTQCAVLSRILHSVLEQLVATDLLTSSALPPNVPPQTLLQIGVNVSNFCARCVDLAWTGVLADAPRLLNSLQHIHGIFTRKENSVIQRETIVNAMMRCVLFVLSRPIDSVNVQMCVLDALNMTLTRRNVWLSTNEAWFFGALTHLVFMLSVTPDILVKEAHDLERASAQVAMCASRVWTDVLLHKKALLEETLRKSTVSELNAARALLAHAAGIQWQAFVDSQLRQNSHTSARDLQHNITSKISRVTSGLQKFTAKRALTLTSANSVSYSSPWRHVSVDREVLLMWIGVHASLLRELVDAQIKRYHEWHEHVRKWALRDWHKLERDLTRERAIWGPEQSSSLEKYKLDTTEGNSRIRRKMIPNENFYYQYPYRPHLDDPLMKAMRAKVAISRDSALYFAACQRRRARTMDSRIVDQSATVSTPSEESAGGAMSFADLSQINSSLIKRLHRQSNNESTEEQPEKELSEASEVATNESDEISDLTEASELPSSQGDSGAPPLTPKQSIDKETSSSSDREEPKKAEDKKPGPDNQTLLRLLEQGEQLHSMFRCARVQGLETAEGLLLFGKEHYYVVDGFTLLKTREIRDLDFLSHDLHDPVVPYTANGLTQPPKVSRTCSKFSYSDIREVHKRRYLLQPIALEVFSVDGRNYLLAFPKRMRDRVYDKLMSMARGNAAAESVGGQKASMAIEQSGRTSLINSIIGQQSVTQRWLQGQISNFEYIMHLNTLAGRSYNDLSQYPVFPWVLSDYSSETLDFTNPKIFRDFSKPMGAQSPDRLEQFMKRYREWDDPTGETPPYMYGTHYSSAMIVVSYLVRMEPFTQKFLQLQGGHFDLADRMFHSVGDAYTSAAKNNMADVKELIPEFFTLPEMFTNKNAFDLGVKQSGVALDSVVLPPWAHGDAREFVRLHRAALESDFVSSHLHEWINLVFGCKQTGEEAVKAHNLFHHLFYEGSVDFESIDDPLTRNATIGFVNNFGQVPTQLFKKPHPQKKVSPVDGYSNTPGVTTQRFFYHSLHSLKPPQAPTKQLKSAVGSVHHSDRTGVVALEQNRVIVGTSRYIAWGFADHSLRIGHVDSEKSHCICETNEADEFTCVACGDERTLFCGTVTGCVSVWNIGLQSKPATMKLRKVLDGHSDAVTCLTVCSAHGMVVSASRDCCVIVWHLSELSFVRQLRKHPHAVSAIAVNDTTGDIATACQSMLHVWSINGELLSVLNTLDTGPMGDMSHMILSLSFSTVNEWDTDNVIVCGTADGVVKIFSCLLVKNDGSVDRPHINPPERHANSFTTVQHRLERQRRRLNLSGSEGTTTSSERGASSTPEIPAGEIAMRDVPEYVRILVQRASLTMHTAFNRHDNTRPAPITAIAPSKDHKCLYIGDGIGRLWCWQTQNDDSRSVDRWAQDISRQQCNQCKAPFSIAERKHHCRNCGNVFCSKCSRFESHVSHIKVHVCQNCYLRLKASSSS